ncbi:MAG: hypothetical protein NT003_04450 [Candidatus Magasanikbacteria bacterium]|nr:hypothetical protein [Candidatus Magasanikbacteria bacterium]
MASPLAQGPLDPWLEAALEAKHLNPNSPFVHRASYVPDSQDQTFARWLAEEWSADKPRLLNGDWLRDKFSRQKFSEFLVQYISERLVTTFDRPGSHTKEFLEFVFGDQPLEGRTARQKAAGCGYKGLPLELCAAYAGNPFMRVYASLQFIIVWNGTRAFQIEIERGGEKVKGMIDIGSQTVYDHLLHRWLTHSENWQTVRTILCDAIGAFQLVEYSRVMTAFSNSVALHREHESFGADFVVVFSELDPRFLPIPQLENAMVVVYERKQFAGRRIDLFHGRNVIASEMIVQANSAEERDNAQVLLQRSIPHLIQRRATDLINNGYFVLVEFKPFVLVGEEKQQGKHFTALVLIPEMHTDFDFGALVGK